MVIDPPAQAVRRALGGDAAARERLFEQIYDRLFRYHGKLTRGDTAAAEELTQETMVRLLRSFHRLRDPERFIPWAFRVATNAWRDWRERRSERARESRGETAPPPAERRELVDRVLAEIERLPEVYRVALTLRYLEGLDYDAMAEILDAPASTVRCHVARGRQMIRRQLEEP